MRETWRWFGPADQISLSDVLQTGALGVVSALHHVPSGSPWHADEIARRKAEIEASGLTWDVIESLPVSEAIKTRSGLWASHVAAWTDSLKAVADADGPRVICYNFMPVLDWTRTELRAPLQRGGTAMRFDLVDFAMFDVHVLRRSGAEADYSAGILAEAAHRFATKDEASLEKLTANIVAGLPGAADHWTLDEVRGAIEPYADLTPDDLRANLIAFLSEVVPAAEELGLRICCHPDDPPFPLLGLPRVMSTLEDYLTVLDAVPSPANGATFCTGSLGVRPDFDPPRFVEALGPRIHFVHLRNTRRDTGEADGLASFEESAHLDGDTDMVATIRSLMDEEGRRRAEGRTDAEIPMRPDHGHDLLDDLGRDGQPGYPLIGRLRGLAELRGVMAAIGAGAA